MFLRPERPLQITQGRAKRRPVTSATGAVGYRQPCKVISDHELISVSLWPIELKVNRRFMKRNFEEGVSKRELGNEISKLIRLARGLVDLDVSA